MYTQYTFMACIRVYRNLQKYLLMLKFLKQKFLPKLADLGGGREVAKISGDKKSFFYLKQTKDAQRICLHIIYVLLS